MHGHFSIKSDVFSFGVIMLEILSGRKIVTFCHSDRFFNLLGYVSNYKCPTFVFHTSISLKVDFLPHFLTCWYVFEGMGVVERWKGLGVNGPNTV